MINQKIEMSGHFRLVTNGPERGRMEQECQAVEYLHCGCLNKRHLKYSLGVGCNV